MKFTELELKGAYSIDIDKLDDKRGFFARAWCKNEFLDRGLSGKINQGNLSFTFKKGTIRGLHFQVKPYSEVKMIRCVSGAVYDVIVDLRKDSPTFKKWTGIELSAQNFRMLYVPEGFAHGFQTLEDNTIVYYHVSEFFNPGAEGGVRWNDPEFRIEWPLEVSEISEKDKNLPDFF